MAFRRVLLRRDGSRWDRARTVVNPIVSNRRFQNESTCLFRFVSENNFRNQVRTSRPPFSPLRKMYVHPEGFWVRPRIWKEPPHTSCAGTYAVRKCKTQRNPKSVKCFSPSRVSGFYATYAGGLLRLYSPTIVSLPTTQRTFHRSPRRF